MLMDVYINDIAVFLPNEPVDNAHIEQVLGKIGDIPSKTKEKILINNGIQTRYYAIDPATGRLTHTNAAMTAAAVRVLKPYPGFKPDDMECLCCGTSSPDVILPGHGLMVHGELGCAPCEVMTTAGICLAGITAFKYAWMNVASGHSRNAVATGSELASSSIRAGFFQYKSSGAGVDMDKDPSLAFNADFLRWMVSDAAGAVFLSDRKNTGGLSLRVDWIEHLSFASIFDTCMYAGGVKQDDGSMVGWRHAASLEEALRQDYFPIKQDTRLLNAEIVQTAVDRTLTKIIRKRQLRAEEVDWFLPHYSSEYFRDKLYDRMAAIGFAVPYEKWFTNLVTKGNTGSASIFVIMEELFHSGKLLAGQKLLCFIPESGRFSMAYMMLTVV
jgi:3-oxoacyl-[acyl-carrier-protein] synthase-3